MLSTLCVVILLKYTAVAVAVYFDCVVMYMAFMNETRSDVFSLG